MWSLGFGVQGSGVVSAGPGCQPRVSFALRGFQGLEARLPSEEVSLPSHSSTPNP